MLQASVVRCLHVCTFALSCLVLSCLVLPGLVLSVIVLCCLILSGLAAILDSHCSVTSQSIGLYLGIYMYLGTGEVGR